MIFCCIFFPLPRSRASSSNQEVQLNFASFRSGGFSIPHVLSTVSISPIPQPIPQLFTAPNTPKASLSNTTTARLSAHLTFSPNTCAAYVQGQVHSPSVAEYAISQSHTTCDLTTPQTFSKRFDDDANHKVRPAVRLQFHDPRVKVRPASPFIHPPLTPSPALYSFVPEVLPFHNGKHSHIQRSHSVEESARTSTPSSPRRTVSYVPLLLSLRR